MPTSDVSPALRFLIVTACCVVVIAGMRAAEQLLVPFLLATFIAVICAPSMNWMRHRGIPTGLAMLAILGVVVVFCFGLVVLVGSSINEFSESVPEYQARLQGLLGQLLGLADKLGIKVSSDVILEYFDPGVAMQIVSNVLKQFGGVMTNAFLILLTVAFMLGEAAVFSDKLTAVMDDPENSRSHIDHFRNTVNQYMALKTWVSLLTGGVIALWLWILGVDFPLLWGTLAFLLNYVPNLGSILAAIPPVLLALVQLGVGPAVATGAGFIAVNMIVGNVIEPRFMGRGLDLSTLVVFFSLVFWGWVLGPVGMLLSVPLTMTVKIALESHEDSRWLGVLLGSSAPEPDTPSAITSEPVAK